jgi:hypothetical protein
MRLGGIDYCETSYIFVSPSYVSSESDRLEVDSDSLNTGYRLDMPF